FHTSTSTVIRRFDTINADMLKEPKQLPSIIAIDEYKGDAGGEKYQTIIADPVDRRPLDILPDRRKLTVKKYLQQHGGNVNMVVMEMSQYFKAEVSQALDSTIIIDERLLFFRNIICVFDSMRI